MMKFNITASIVLYKTNRTEVEIVIKKFLATSLNVKLYLIDNSPTDILKTLANDDNRIEYIFNNKNVGYGAAHNVAINRTIDKSEFHIILNPDIDFKPEILLQAYNYMKGKDEIGLLSPRILYPDGRHQHMCRMLPSPFNLLVRRFLPKYLKPLFKKNHDNYLLLHLDFNKPYNIPNLPGSFMFINNKALKEVGGFDEHFFMYLEDVDLTRRIHEKFKTIYYPEITITHKLEQGSYKSKILLKYHINSAIYYFNKWGWIADFDRYSINKKLIKQSS
jgi:GT2 family glycosyltransferase